MKRKLVYIFIPIIGLGLLLALILVYRLPFVTRLASQLHIFSPIAKVGMDISNPNVNFLSTMEKEIVSEMNLARTNPQQYAAYLEEWKKYYMGNRFQQPGKNAIVTNEGLSAVDEAIRFLRSTNPLPPFGVSKGMSLGAKDHAKDLGMTGGTGHKGSDGSLTEDRVNRYGNWENAIGENITYDTGTARDAVIALIIDDGNPNRGHRKNIFNSNYNVTGVALGERSMMGTLYVITYAGGFAEKTTSTGAQRF